MKNRISTNVCIVVSTLRGVCPGDILSWIRLYRPTFRLCLVSSGLLVPWEITQSYLLSLRNNGPQLLQQLTLL